MSTGKLLNFHREIEWHSKVECDNYGKMTRFAFERAHSVEVLSRRIQKIANSALEALI